jgi:DNA-directed RNA polymerase subunit omega
MYLEDILEKGVNKYLVVNIAAQRGRHINEKGIPMLMDNAQKPVTLALEELNEGKLSHKKLEKPIDTLEDSPFGTIDNEEEEEAAEELQPTEEYVFDDSNLVVDAEEQEEGL